MSLSFDNIVITQDSQGGDTEALTATQLSAVGGEIIGRRQEIRVL